MRNSADIKGSFDLIYRAGSWHLSQVFCSCKAKSIFHHDWVYSECKNSQFCKRAKCTGKPSAASIQRGAGGGCSTGQPRGSGWRTEITATTFSVEQNGHRQSCRLCFLVSGFLEWLWRRAHGKIIMWKHVRVSWHLIRCRIPTAWSNWAAW